MPGEPSIKLNFRLDVDQTAVPSSGDRVGISTSDLAVLSRFVDVVSDAVAEQAAWRLMKALDVPGGVRVSALGKSAARRRAVSPAQVTSLNTGSIEIGITLLPALVFGWVMKELVGEAVRTGWQESAGRQRLVDASRNLFGGAAETVERAAARASLPANVSVETVTAEGGPDGGEDVRVVVRKNSNPELEAFKAGERLLAPRSIRPYPEDSSGILYSPRPPGPGEQGELEAGEDEEGGTEEPPLSR